MGDETTFPDDSTNRMLVEKSSPRLYRFSIRPGNLPCIIFRINAENMTAAHCRTVLYSRQKSGFQLLVDLFLIRTASFLYEKK
jgi:hypothetical protein